MERFPFLSDRLHLTDARNNAQAYFSIAISGKPARTFILWWLLGVALIFAAEYIFSFGFYKLAFSITPQSWQVPVHDGTRFAGFADYLARFLWFIIAFAAPLIVWKFLHKLPLGRLFSYIGRLRWRRLFIAMGIVAIIYPLWTVIYYCLFPQDLAELTWQTNWNGWLILTVITLILCPIQAGSEEFLVRGYLNQGLIKTFRSPWPVFILTSAFFAWLHTNNPESEGQYWQYMASIFVFGIGMCVLVYYEGGLESAMGYHIANNIYAFSIFGYADPTLPDSAIVWTPRPVISWADVLQETVIMIFVIVAILKLNRKWAN